MWLLKRRCGEMGIHESSAERRASRSRRCALGLMVATCLAATVSFGSGCDDAPDDKRDLVGQLTDGLDLVEADAPELYLGVWGASDEAVWIAGGTVRAGVILYYDGASLGQESTPPGPMLWWVFGFGPEQVWACGHGGRVLRRTDGVWRAETTGLEENAVLWGVWGSGPNDLWAVGGSVRPDGPKGIVLRSTGDGTWTQIEDPSFPDDLSHYKVWGTGPDDVHIVGDGGVTIHWDGQGFTRADTAVPETIFTVHGRPGGPILAVGGTAEGLAYRYEDGAWAQEDFVEGVPPLNGVFVLEDGHAIMTGGRGVVYVRSPTGQYTRVEARVQADLGSQTLHAVWHGQHSWMVGGNIVRGNNGVIVSDVQPAPTQE